MQGVTAVQMGISWPDAGSPLGAKAAMMLCAKGEESLVRPALPHYAIAALFGKQYHLVLGCLSVAA